MRMCGGIGRESMIGVEDKDTGKKMGVEVW